jgi:excisionase family DNA binding protein
VNLDDIRGRTVITVAETAELLGLDQRTVRRGIEAGDLPGIRVGKRIVVPVAKLIALLEEEDPAPPRAQSRRTE